MIRRVQSVLIPAFVIACCATGALAQGGPPGGLGVNVLNTPLAVVDKHVRTPYQNGAKDHGSCQNNAACQITFPAVPANHRLVITHVSGLIFFGAPSGSVNNPAFLLSLYNGVLGSPLVRFFIPTVPPFSVAGWDHSVLFYLDAGQTPSVFVDALGATFGGVQEATLVGEMIDCSVSVCTPIAQ